MKEVNHHRAGDFVVVHAYKQPVWSTAREPEQLTFIGRIDTVRFLNGGSLITYEIGQVPMRAARQLKSRFNNEGELWVGSDEIDTSTELVDRIERLCSKYGFSEKDAFELLRAVNRGGFQGFLQRIYRTFATVGIVEGDPQAKWSTNEEFCKIKLAEFLELKDEVDASSLTVLDDYR